MFTKQQLPLSQWIYVTTYLIVCVTCLSISPVLLIVPSSCTGLYAVAFLIFPKPMAIYFLYNKKIAYKISSLCFKSMYTCNSNVCFFPIPITRLISSESFVLSELVLITKSAQYVRLWDSPQRSDSSETPRYWLKL